MVSTARTVNVKGKVILPLPSLIEAMAKKQLMIDKVKYQHALYAPAFIKLINALSNDFKMMHNKDGKMIFPDYSVYGPYMGYAVFDSFEDYHLVRCDEPVDFKLAGTDNWHRPYDFGIYSKKSLKPELNDPHVHVKLINQGDRFYITPKLIGKDLSQGMINEFMIVANTTIGQNARTTNAFMHKFGVQMKSPNLQSILDAGEHILEQYSD